MADATQLAGRLVERARLDGVRVSITLTAAFGDPFEGRVEPGHVLDLAGKVAVANPDEIVLADTIGVGVPNQVRELVEGALTVGTTVGCHFHDTRNTGIANAAAAVESGATVLDASVGGTGGCPFAPRATGNIATEDLVYLLHGMGHETGIDLEALIEVAEWLAQQLGKELPGQVYKAGTFEPMTGRTGGSSTSARPPKPSRPRPFRSYSSEAARRRSRDGGSHPRTRPVVLDPEAAGAAVADELFVVDLRRPLNHSVRVTSAAGRW